MVNPRAADDFDAIRKRMEEMRRGAPAAQTVPDWIQLGAYYYCDVPEDFVDNWHSNCNEVKAGDCQGPWHCLSVEALEVTIRWIKDGKIINVRQQP